MGFFGKLGARVRNIFTLKVERQILQPNVEPRQKWLTRLQNFFTPKVEKQILEPVVEQSHESAEARALRAATEMLITASQHPGDATYEYARREALVYIEKSQKLLEKGKTQSGNREFVAKKYLDREISSEKGVQARKARKLQTFNANFGFQLTESQADTVGQLMESTSFKKLMETFREKYDILIGMVGDQIEKGIDPVRVEQTLDLWQQVGIEPDFSDFARATELQTDEFNAMREDLLIYNEESVNADEYERAENIEGILGRYMPW